MNPLALVSRVYRHIRAGTFADALLLRNPFLPDPARVIWDGRQHPAQAARALARCARRIGATRQSSAGWVLSLGRQEDFHARLNRWLDFEGVVYRSHDIEEVERWNTAQSAGLVAIIAGYPDTRSLTRISRVLASHPVLGTIPFEYPMGLDREAEVFSRLDEYSNTRFVSPVLLKNPSPYELYEESLQYFSQKCGLRDFLDLYQLLQQVTHQGVPGDVAEFGSYQGHSGWLLARSLQALGSDKKLFLFDMFEEFPDESIGIDQSWNRSHRVDFAEVRAKFQNFANVTLVKGDFTETLKTSALGPVALAHVDCDSYRATRFLLDTLLPGSLSPRGVLVCEDYGHPALLGHRAAVHDSLDQRTGLFSFFSEFSGLYIIVKH